MVKAAAANGGAGALEYSRITSKPIDSMPCLFWLAKVVLPSVRARAVEDRPQNAGAALGG